MEKIPAAKLPAITGWLWVKEGFALFRKQPMELSVLFLSYLFIMVVLSIIPKLGQWLALTLVPILSMGFMQACAHIEQNKAVPPSLLTAGFRSPALRTLMILGVLYLLAAVAALACSIPVDGGALWNLMTGKSELNVYTIRDSNIMTSMLFAGALYTPAAMAFWYAAPLAMWQNMSAGKALFYSFFAVRRAGKAFLIYGLAWVLIGVLLPSIFSLMVALLFGNPNVISIVLLPMVLVLTVAMYCSFYPTYTHVFGKPL